MGTNGEWWGDDPEDDDEEDEAAERNRKRSLEKPDETKQRIRENARGFSEVPDGETGDEILKRLARSHVELSISTLVDVAERGTKDAARNTAAKELLARGFGGVTRKSEQKVDVKIQDQRAAHFSALQELAKRNPVLNIEDAEFDEIPQTPKRLGHSND